MFPKVYSESHHILPRALGGSDDPINIVRLTAKEHFIAHLLLAKIHGGPMITAVFLMSCYGRYRSRTYSYLRLQFSRRKSEGQVGTNNVMYGKSHSDETKNKMSIARLGVSIKPMSNQEKERRRKITGKDHPSFGRKASEETRMKLRECNGGENNPMYGKKHSQETKDKIGKSSAGRPSPLKGRSISEETKKKISEARKGRKYPRENKASS